MMLDSRTARLMPVTTTHDSRHAVRRRYPFGNIHAQSGVRLPRVGRFAFVVQQPKSDKI